MATIDNFILSVFNYFEAEDQYHKTVETQASFTRIFRQPENIAKQLFEEATTPIYGDLVRAHNNAYAIYRDLVDAGDGDIQNQILAGMVAQINKIPHKFAFGEELPKSVDGSSISSDES